jgi:hypothetical protein
LMSLLVDCSCRGRARDEALAGPGWRGLAPPAAPDGPLRPCLRPGCRRGRPRRLSPGLAGDAAATARSCGN